MSLRITPTVTTCNDVDVPSSEISGLLVTALGEAWQDCQLYMGGDWHSTDRSIERAAALYAMREGVPPAEVLTSTAYSALIRQICTATAHIRARSRATSPTTPDDLRLYAAGRRRKCIDAASVVIPNGRTWIDNDSAGAVGRTIQAIDLSIAAAPLSWKLVEGFVQVTREDLIGIGQAIATAQQQAFGVEASLVAGIAAGTITTAAQIDAAAWPGTS